MATFMRMASTWAAYEVALERANDAALVADAARREADTLYAAAVSLGQEPLPICPVCKQDNTDDSACWQCRRDHR